jgi:glycogen synthase
MPEVSRGQYPADGSLRIALMPSAYAPAVGGVEVLTARLAHHLQLRGHAVEVWTSRSESDALPQREVIDGFTVRRFVFAMPRADLRTLALTPAAARRTLGAMRAAAAEFRPTHLHVQCFSGNGAYATALGHTTGVPLVVTLQGETLMDDHDIYGRSVTLRAALRWGLRRAAAVTGCSQFTLDDAIARFGLRPEKATVVFNGVDPEETAPQPVDLPFDRYVLALGRVVRNKGFDLLLAAFAQISSGHPGVGLVIGGAGPELEKLRNQARILGLADRVHFPGPLDRGQVATVMAGADVFVMPSRLEPFGIVVLEAWRAGVPVIVTSRGGAPEFVRHQVNGLVADPTDRLGLGEAIAGFLADGRTRRRLGAAGASSLQGFTWAELARRYEDVYAAARPVSGERDAAAPAVRT